MNARILLLIASHNALAALLLCSSPVVAETFPVPHPDPHASSWGERGSFTVYYFGQLTDGTGCPPSPNALKYAIADEQGDLKYLHGFGVDSQTPDTLAAHFASGTFCSVAFDGEVRFLLHHGMQARIRPSAVSPPQAPGDDASDGPIL